MHCDMLKIQDGVAIVEKLNYARPINVIRLMNVILLAALLAMYFSIDGEKQNNVYTQMPKFHV